MIRILIFILLLAAAAAGLTALLAVDGNVHVEFGDYVYFNPAAPTLLAIAIGLVLLVCLVLGISYLMRMPDKVRARNRERQRQKGIISLTRGLEAVAAGDASDAQRHAKHAQRQLEEPSLTRLLTAQAAQLAGDHETAEENFAAMLEAPETEFLGLRGLYLQAMGAGDTKAAKEYADRAFKLRPSARWAYDSVYQLSIERGGWSDAQNALKLARKNGLEDGDHIRRREAALVAARAYSADAAGEKDDALKDATEAFKLAPDFPPAATLAAQLENAKGHRSRAAKILREAWAARPHPAIRRTYLDLYTDLPPQERAGKLEKLIEKAPQTPPNRQIEAEIAIARGEYAKAKDILEPLLGGNPTGRTFSLMASVMRGLHDEVAAEPWLERAADAPREAGPGADGVFHFTTDGWRRLVYEFGEHNRLAPPPLEEVSAAMTREEIRLLAAPPPAPEPEPEPVITPADDQGAEPVGETPPISPAAASAGPEPDGQSDAPSEGYSEPEDAPENNQADQDAKKQRELEDAEAALRNAGYGGEYQKND